MPDCLLTAADWLDNKSHSIDGDIVIRNENLTIQNLKISFVRETHRCNYDSCEQQAD